MRQSQNRVKAGGTVEHEPWSGPPPGRTAVKRAVFWGGCQSSGCCQNTAKMALTASAGRSRSPPVTGSPGARAFRLCYSRGRAPFGGTEGGRGGGRRQDLTWNDPRRCKPGDSAARVRARAHVFACTRKCASVGLTVRAVLTVRTRKLQHGGAER